MAFRSCALTLSGCMSTALLGGCADGGSSATHPTGIVPAAAQQGTVAGAQGPLGGSVHSGVRRTLSVTSCLGVTGPATAFLGINNTNADAGQYSVVVGGQKNQACDSYSTIVGGYSNAVSGTEGVDSQYSFIGGGLQNTLTGTDYSSAIVGGDGNQVSGASSAIVGGDTNSVAGFQSAIVGGVNNSVASGDSLVGGGSGNTISGPGYAALVGGFQNSLSGKYGFIGAGISNTVSGEGGYVAAGGYNTVSGEGAVIDGGFNSTAAGTFATIPGGYVNSAAGTYSFAAGARASAAQNGTFVWSDGSDGDTILTSTQAYQFLARASGGFTLYTNAASTVGAQLAAGSGTWASLSDRNVKTNIVPLDDATVLDKIAALPISRWSYKSERGVRHVGPMAQDFYAAFEVGEDDKHITSIDEDGVALAAIKALHAENAELRAQARRERQERRTVTHSQSVEIAALRADLASIRAELRAKR
jgi:trimeric autotransporter adhesin